MGHFPLKIKFEWTTYQLEYFLSQASNLYCTAICSSRCAGFTDCRTITSIYLEWSARTCADRSEAVPSHNLALCRIPMPFIGLPRRSFARKRPACLANQGRPRLTKP